MFSCEKFAFPNSLNVIICIYVGENLVVHFINPDRNLSAKSSFTGSSSLITSFPTTCSNPGCDFTKDNNGVTISCLDCFLKNGSLYRYHYGVSRYTCLVKIRGGTCTSAKSDPEDIVVNRTMYLLHTGFGNYDLIKNNCEDFALYCKIGRKLEASSGQVISILPRPLPQFINWMKFA
ncbi:hypothetical protein RD792_005582 [Penstemon davidsonii]|uniref:LRAT domain-containing protein n=1 Tax=Penstemon davidsonii TaxID=160366 RepID=A0ABR0DEU7_9LAMI|nr:hypothetical protein RD792_005582 [Penstemon davidsonii]